MRRLIPESEVLVYAGGYPQMEAHMKRCIALFVLATTLSACGVETATTAATVAEMKRREMEAAKKNLDSATQKIEQNTQQSLQKAADAEKVSKD
jgi:outer membrane PBP1 activator LpoA protein